MDPKIFAIGGLMVGKKFMTQTLNLSCWADKEGGLGRNNSRKQAARVLEALPGHFDGHFCFRRCP